MMRRQHGEDGIVTHRGNTELAKNVCPRLRDLATAPAGGITQRGTNFFGQLCSVTENFGCSDNHITQYFFSSQKGPSHTENQQIAVNPTQASDRLNNPVMQKVQKEQKVQDTNMC